MTSDENPADAIEAAVTVIEAAHRSMFDEMRAAGVKHESGVHRVFARYARAVADAHLLADPADRDELEDLREEVAWRREASKEYGRIADQYEADLRTLRVDLSTAERMSGDIEDRAERAEAEVAELRATVEKVRAIHERDTHYNECVVCDVVWPCPTIRALDGGAS